MGPQGDYDDDAASPPVKVPWAALAVYFIGFATAGALVILSIEADPEWRRPLGYGIVLTFVVVAVVRWRMRKSENLPRG